MKHILKNTWTILEKKERSRFIALLLLDVVISIIDILSLVFLLAIIQFYIQPGNPTGMGFLPEWLQDRGSVALIGIFFLVFSLKNLAGFLIARAHYIFIGQVAVRISDVNLLKYQQGDFGEFVHTDSSVFIRRIAYQPFEFGQYLLAGLQQIITQLILITITLIAIIIFDARLFLLLMLILLPPIVIVFIFIRKRSLVIRRHIQSSNELSFRYLLDALKGWVEGNVYGRNQFFRKRFTDARQKFSTHLFNSLSLQSLPNRFIEIFAVLGLFILILIAKWWGGNDTTPLLTIGAFMAAAYKIIPGIVKIINVSGQIKTYEPAATELAALTIVENQDKPTQLAMDTMELKNVSFSFGNQTILDNFSMIIKPGDFIGITGISGRGKTTILNIILGFLKPSSGELLVNDLPLDSKTVGSHLPQIAYVRQQSFFIHDTLMRNITLEEDCQVQASLQQAIRVAGLEALLAKSSQKDDMIISENGKNISGGQQQRVAIARALYKDARLLLLDEPFNELDQVSSEHLLQHFRDLAREGKMIVLITHDKKSLAYCNKIISLDENG
ncbi:MAG: ABC transporter ATP-binding protein [Chitinophagaceae bacterium]|nr:ABC transporter ATP-binding protein [Chitinophagaceae bacterium]